MNKEIIDLAVREEDARNSLDSIFSQIERLNLRKDIGPIKQNIENELLYIERSLQDLAEYNEEIYKRFIVLAYDCLYKINQSLESSISVNKLRVLLPIIRNLGINLSILLTEDFQNLPIGDKEIKFFQIKNIEYEIESTIERTIIEKITSLITNPNFRLTRIKNALYLPFSKGIKSIKSILIGKIDVVEDWRKPLSIKLKIKDKENAQSELFILWLLMELLSQVDELDVTLIKIKKGSIISEILLLFRSEKAKIEVNTILNQTKQGIAEYSKNIDNIKNKTSSTTSYDEVLTDEDAFYEAMKVEKLESTRLDNERKQLENDRIKLTNDRLRLENERLTFILSVNKKKILNNLLIREIVSRDEFIMLMSGRNFINYKKKDFQDESEL